LSRQRSSDPPPGEPAQSALGPLQLALVGVAFAVVGLLIYSPSLEGDFVSDDLHYVQNNPYIQDPGFDELAAILNPRSEVPLLVENYAPVHLLLHALEWKAFGSEVTGYHVVNVLLHALAALLLIPLLQRSGVGAGAALLGGALFLVHPANVEAVAWISQLKSPASLVLALLALLAHPRRPALAVALFGLGLFAKPLVAFALAVAVLLGWSRPPPGPGAGRFALDPGWRWGWLGGWALVLGLFAVVELQAFSRTAGNAIDLYPELFVRLRSNLAIVARYLWMSASGTGLSTFHEPPPSGPGDPVWLAAVVALGLLGWRTLFCLRKRRAEGAYLAWAVIAYLPVCGLLVPLTYPMADRYLYFILPGLIGAALLAAPALLESLARLAGRPSATLALGRGTMLAAIALGISFGVASFARAAIWTTSERVLADSVRHYPDGNAATMARAARAAQAGDSQEALRQLRVARARGYTRVDQLIGHPAYGPIRSHPEFQALLAEMASSQLERLNENADPSQLELHSMAMLYDVRGETDRAVEALERALAEGGPIDDRIRSELENLRRKQRLERLRNR